MKQFKSVKLEAVNNLQVLMLQVAQKALQAQEDAGILVCCVTNVEA